MKMQAPQIIMLVLLGLSVVINICNHGKERPAYDGPMAFLSCIFSLALLYWGGFFG